MYVQEKSNKLQINTIVQVYVSAFVVTVCGEYYSSFTPELNLACCV